MCRSPIQGGRGTFNGRMVRAVVALRTSGFRYASLSALLGKDQDFSNGRACFGHRRSLDDSCGQRPCQTLSRRLSPSRLQISERNSTLR